MNITDRKHVKDERKVMAWGPKEVIYEHIKSQIPEIEERGEKK